VPTDLAIAPTPNAWDFAPPIRPGEDPLIEQRIGGDLVLGVFRCAADPNRLYVLAFDADGNYLSRIATVRGIGAVAVAPIWDSVVATARELHPRLAGRDLR
jgi:hypothetical protein